jgi:hypothetical protein
LLSPSAKPSRVVNIRTCAGGRSISRSIAPAIVTFAPMPIASVTMTSAAKPGARRI